MKEQGEVNAGFQETARSFSGLNLPGTLHHHRIVSIHKSIIPSCRSRLRSPQTTTGQAGMTEEPVLHTYEPGSAPPFWIPAVRQAHGPEPVEGLKAGMTW